MSLEKKLKTMSERGGTSNEREVARKKLEAMKVREVETFSSEEKDDNWFVQGLLIRERRGAKAYLRQDALKYFLSKVATGSQVTYRTIPLQENFGSGDFYVIVSWLLKNGLCTKMGSKYRIVSKAGIVALWNESIDKMRL